MRGPSALSQPRRRSARSPLPLTMAMLAVTVFTVTMSATPALAHDTLVDSTQDRAALDEAPQEATLPRSGTAVGVPAEVPAAEEPRFTPEVSAAGGTDAALPMNGVVLGVFVVGCFLLGSLMAVGLLAALAFAVSRLRRRLRGGDPGAITTAILRMFGIGH